MAVTFGCPLVGTMEELNSKVLKNGQRAFAINGDGKDTNWKTGDGSTTFENLPWDLNNGGDNKQTQSDWLQENTEARDFIKNKPDLTKFENQINLLQEQINNLKYKRL